MKRKLRLANYSFFSALPFRPLANVDFIDYQEYTPLQNAHLLHEGLVDAALIPITEYARHSGYVGLDFGLASRTEIEGVMVFGDDPIEEMDTIYVDECSGSGTALLRLLLARKWNVKPRLIRVRAENLDPYIGPGAGSLMIGDRAINAKDRYPVKVDLSAAWHELTGLPFAYSIWAARPWSLVARRCGWPE